MLRITSLPKHLIRAIVVTLLGSTICLTPFSNADATPNGPTPTPAQGPGQASVNNQNTLVDFENFITRLRDRTMTGHALVPGETNPTDPTSPLLTNPEVYQLYTAFKNSDQSSDAIMQETQKKLQGATDTTIKQIVKQLSDLLAAPSPNP